MPSVDLQPGERLHGFQVQGITGLPELNGQVVRLQHEATGARYLHLAADDDNNLFAVGFRTPPADSTGAPHILEHTVLCGSRRYPVRDPFFSMLKRSLATFMNALTADDWTLYPFATQNRADFYNLLGVYLDAVFFPLLREQDFRQEGHRLELADPEDPSSPLVIKGVVYNEMKGHMSDPHSLLGTRVAEALYPTTPYGRNAGGEPRQIPELTWERLRAFHAAHYHPSNAYLFSYGNLPVAEHLAAVEEQALGRFRRTEPATEVPPEAAFDAPRQLRKGFAVDPGEPTAGRTMVQVAWVTCPIADDLRRLGMGVLSILLLGNPAAPLYRALLESGLGANLTPGSGYNDDNRQTTFAAGLQGTEPDRAQAVEELVLETLGQLAAEGFDAERVAAAVHQLEFHHREVKGNHYPYALGLLARIMGPWIHGADPVQPLLLGENIARLRAALGEGTFLQDLIRQELLENPHRVTLTLAPDPELGAQESAAVAAHLTQLRSRLGAADLQRIAEQARQLEANQEAAEDLSCLPTLAVADIPEQGSRVPSEELAAGSASLRWYEQPTNGIDYFSAYFAAADLEPELLPQLPLFAACLARMGAAGRSYTEMAERVSAHTGGVGAGVSLLEDPRGVEQFQALVQVEGKALERNRERLFDILGDFLATPDFSDRERLRTVLNQIKTSLENSIPGMGHRYALRLAAASLSPGGRWKECWAGIEHLRFVKQVAALEGEALAPVAERFARIAARVFAAPRARCGAAGQDSARDGIVEGVARLCATLPEGGAGASRVTAEQFTPEPCRLGVMASVPVSYVARVFPAPVYSDPDAPALLVLAKLLKASFLHREVREKGGAYGGMAGYTPEAGLFSMASYRDPQLTRTLGVFEDAAAWAAAGRFGAGEIREALLGVFSDLDRPLSPGGRAAKDFAEHLQGLTWERVQEFREGVLAVDKPKLVAVAERYLVAGLRASAVAVLSNEEALQAANRELTEAPLELTRI